MRLVHGLLIAAIVTLAGCGKPAERVTGEPGPVTARASTPAGPASPSPSAPSAAPIPVPTGIGPAAQKRDIDAPFPLATGARVAKHPGLDRVVIDLKGQPTGYDVRYVPKLVRDGSGEPVPLTGGAYLEIRITPANAHTEQGAGTWQGPTTVSVGQANVKHLVLTGDFEAVVTVGLVLNRKAAFRVGYLTSPTRLVIDVAH